MGAFYGSFHVRTSDAGAVRDALTGLAAAGTAKFLIAPPRGAWISVYPSGHGQDTEPARLFAEATGLAVLHLLVHDDDVFVYQVYRDRALVDEYCSDPDYFKEVGAAEHERTAGRPQAFADWLDDAESAVRLAGILNRSGRGRMLDSVASVLRTGRFDATARMVRMAALLGIANVETSYEYIRQGETRGVKGASALVHVPDLAEEKARQSKAKADVRALKTRLRDEGVLLVSEVRKGGNRLFSPRPIVASAADRGFLVAWSDPGRGESVPVEVYGPPWTTVPFAIDLRVPDTVHTTAVSARGNYLAVGHASGRWRAELYALDDGRRVCDLPQARAVDFVGFTPDERLLLCRSESTLEIVSTQAGEVLRRLELGRGDGNKCAIHPDGRWVTADSRTPRDSAIVVLDLTDSNPPRRLATARHDLAAWMARAQRGEILSGFYPQDMPRALAFTPDGQFLLVAVHHGVRAFAWDGLLQAGGELPAAIAQADTAPVRVGSSAIQFTHTVCPHPARNLVMFSGSDGCIRALDLATGSAQVLVEVPEQPSLFQMVISHDGGSIATVSSSMEDRRGPRRFALDIWDLSVLLDRATALR